MTEPDCRTGTHGKNRRYLALWFPFLPTDRPILSGLLPPAAPGEPPLALTEKQRGAIRLAACDERALELGLAPGMTLADARARIPGLRVAERDPAAEEGWLRRIAAACDRFTPMVAPAPPDLLMLDITGCAHLFGGEGALLAAVDGAMREWASRWRPAIADTPDAARALARFGEMPDGDETAALLRLPVAALELDAEGETALRRAGFRRLGDLAEHGPAALTARFGQAMVDRLDRILTRADSRISPRRAAASLVFERRFPEPLARIDDALAVIGALAAEAATVLEQRHRGGRAFAVRLFRSDGRTFDLRVESSRPLRDPARIMHLFHETLESLADPLDPGFGFDTIRLVVPRTEAMAAAQLALEGGSVNEEALASLIDRLSTRLGPESLRRFAPQDSHMPEQAALALPAIAAPRPARWAAPDTGEPPRRPIHLFDPPQPVDVIAEVPDGPPQRFRWRRAVHDVARFEGPERIAPEWWRRPSDVMGRTRDYYRVEDVRGRRFWLFRHGLYGEGAGDPRWYVHGLFA